MWCERCVVLLQKICKELGESMSLEQTQSMFDHADLGGKGYVSFDDFFKLMKKKQNPNNPLNKMLEDDD